MYCHLGLPLSYECYSRFDNEFCPKLSISQLNCITQSPLTKKALLKVTIGSGPVTI